ncbi:MAG: DUF2156 domain-containing protein [Lachnospiraceae bacterium]|nr:DUF2156 domain-containing protein [Lachnospiraceae bacterium]
MIKYSNMIDFVKIPLGSKEKVDSFFCRFGEGSCQHSFATGFCFDTKYDDHFCIKDDFLYTLRNGISDDTYRTYLFPMGDLNNIDGIKAAIENIISDAKSYNKKVKFQSISENAQNILKSLYGDKFAIEDRRDLYEYMYKYETIAIMEGSHFKAKRNEIRKFFKDYENIVVKIIDKADVTNIKNLYKLWVDADEGRQSNTQLDYEEIALDRALEHYDELGLDGIVIYCSDELIGFVFGVKLNDEVFDFMIEKANAKYGAIYKVLNNELAKICCSNFKYVNFEEDLGEEGLRNSKLMYHPDILFKKFVAVEV